MTNIAESRDRRCDSESRCAPGPVRWCGAALALVLICPLASPARAGTDEGRLTCDYCRMILEHDDFGGDLRTADRRVLIFDATECMAAYWITHHDSVKIESMSSIRRERPAERINALRAWYVHSDSLPSPMGMRLAAYGSAAMAYSQARRPHGTVLKWWQVVDLVQRTWFAKRP